MAESPSSQQHVVPSMGGGGREVNAGILENRSPPTGRMELLDWINNFLKSDYLKIEHLSDGIAYCRIFAKLFPGSVTTRKLNLKAKYSSHNLQNLAILDEAFHRLHIPRQVPMKKLANGKFQDNYEFSLWIVRYIYKDKKLLSKAQAIIYSQSTSGSTRSSNEVAMSATTTTTTTWRGRNIRGEGIETSSSNYYHHSLLLPPSGTPGHSPYFTRCKAGGKKKEEEEEEGDLKSSAYFHKRRNNDCWKKNKLKGNVSK